MEMNSKDIPRTPLQYGADNETWIIFYKCPLCGNILKLDEPHCYKCGQSIDWSIRNGRRY